MYIIHIVVCKIIVIDFYEFKCLWIAQKSKKCNLRKTYYCPDVLLSIQNSNLNRLFKNLRANKFETFDCKTFAVFSRVFFYFFSSLRKHTISMYHNIFISNWICLAFKRKKSIFFHVRHGKINLWTNGFIWLLNEPF